MEVKEFEMPDGSKVSVPEEKRMSFNNTSVPNILNYKTIYDYCSITFDDNLSCGNIEKIDMVRLTGISVAIGQGSKIKIWGVRA